MLNNDEPTYYMKAYDLSHFKYFSLKLYSPSCVTIKEFKSSLSLRLEINFHPTSGLVNLSLVMTEDYPSSKPPVSHFWAPNLKAGIIETINKRLRSIWEDFEGKNRLWIQLVWSDTISISYPFF